MKIRWSVSRILEVSRREWHKISFPNYGHRYAYQRLNTYITKDHVKLSILEPKSEISWHVPWPSIPSYLACNLENKERFGRLWLRIGYLPQPLGTSLHLHVSEICYSHCSGYHAYLGRSKCEIKNRYLAEPWSTLALSLESVGTKLKTGVMGERITPRRGAGIVPPTWA